MSQYETDRENTAVGPELCDECGHPTRLHGSEGCAFERGDRYESGYAPMAGGPCGCQATELEPVNRDSYGKGPDPLEVLLERHHRIRERLLASRDTQAIRASNANTRMFIAEVKGKR